MFPRRGNIGLSHLRGGVYTKRENAKENVEMEFISVKYV
jgi:hypothetical protein